MLGLAAAPEIDIARPTESSPPYSGKGRYPVLLLPQYIGLNTNDSAILSCHASCSP